MSSPRFNKFYYQLISTGRYITSRALLNPSLVFVSWITRITKSYPLWIFYLMTLGRLPWRPLLHTVGSCTAVDTVTESEMQGSGVFTDSVRLPEISTAPITTQNHTPVDSVVKEGGPTTQLEAQVCGVMCESFCAVSPGFTGTSWLLNKMWL